MSECGQDSRPTLERNTRDRKEKEKTNTETVNPGLVFSINITLSWKYTFLVMTVHHLLRNKLPRYNATHLQRGLMLWIPTSA